MISVKTTKKIQGIAILFMIIHHYILLVVSSNGYTTNLELFVFYIGWFCKLCVALFLICSGIGMYYKQEKLNNSNLKKYCKKKGIKLYNKYILIFLFSMPIFFNCLGYSFNVKTILLHIVLYDSSYNSSWWFVNTYILLILLFPYFRNILNRKEGILYSFFLILLSYIFKYSCDYLEFNIFSHKLFEILYLVLTNQFTFCLGYIFAKKYKDYSKRINISIISSIIIFILLFVIRSILYSIGLANVYSDTFIALTLLCLIINKNCKGIDNILLYFGNHSTNLWLLHMLPILFILKHNMINISFFIGFLGVVLISFILDYLVIFLEKILEISTTKLSNYI